MLVLASASGPIHAQASGQLQLVFTGGSNAVPVGGWATLAATLVVALAAYLILRRLKAPGRVAGVVAASAAVLASWGLDGIAPAWAKTVTPLPLASSPATIQVPGGTGFFEARNVLGTPIRITAINYQSFGSPTSYIQPYPQMCTVGMSLGPGQFCYIYIDFDV